MLHQGTKHMIELDFGNTPEKLKGDYLNIYEIIHLKILSPTRFNESSD